MRLMLLLIAALLVSDVRNPAPRPPHYRAVIVKVLDGDSLRAAVTGWPAEINPVELRLDGIDTPELPPRAKCPAEAALAAKAKAFTARAAPPGRIVTLIWKAGNYDKYGRMLVTIAAGATPDLGAALRVAGLARAYSGGKRRSWCQ